MVEKVKKQSVTGGNNMKNNKNRRPSSRRGLTIACGVLGAVLVLLLAFTVYTEYLLNQMHYVDPDETRAHLSDEEVDAILSATQATSSDDEPATEFTGPTMNAEDVQLGTAGVQIGTEDAIVNILLIGADYQDTDMPRSDTAMLVTFNQEKGTVTMTSFMRDTYVAIPGYSKNKLNAAYSLGGMSLLEKTLNVNFGVHVDGIVEVDFTQFEKIIDLLGGIDLELTKEEAAWINKKADSSLEAGVQHLNGRLAMWYSRNRTSNGGGDYSRTNRQRIVLNTLIETYKNAKLTTIVGMLDQILPMITTNMTKEEIVNYVVELFPMLLDAEIVSQRIPIGDGSSKSTGHLMTMINEMSVLVPNIDMNVQYLIDTIGASDSDAPGPGGAVG